MGSKHTFSSVTQSELPLSDVRVLDLGQAIAGPICGTFLADLGADVIKIERPGGEVYRINRRERDGIPYNPPFELFNRNKRSLCLDLKTDEGMEVLYDLVEEADIFLQNWPPGIAERLGLDYETLQEYNEDIVYVHVSGYGETGPAADKPAMDAIIQHVSGFSSLLGFEGDDPIRSQSSLADFYAGYNAALSALAALRRRDLEGEGDKVDISMLHSMMHNVDGAFEYHNQLGEELPRGGKNGFFAPDMLYGAAEAADGYVAIALLLYSDRVWEAYCDVLDRPDLLEKEKYQTDDGRMDDAGELSARFEEWVADHTVEEVLDRLDEAGIPAAKVNSISEAADLPQVEHDDIFTEIDHPKMGSLELTDTPLSLEKSEPSIRLHAPLLGEHNDDVLADLGYSEAEIEALDDSDVLVRE
jgi:crotonobetainyl-CoA:carnitine CoA-transferase CaiB-like acyl-CoA transferase